VAQEIGNNLKGGEVLALVGEMGAGKTTFMQGLAHGLGIERNLNSPTYIIIRSYELINKQHTTNNKVNKLIHVDLYRLEGDIKQELINLGLLEQMGKPENIVAIEWAKKAKEILPQNTKWVEFYYVSEQERRIIINE